MHEQIERLRAQRRDTDVKIARTQADRAIGEMVVKMRAEGAGNIGMTDLIRALLDVAHADGAPLMRREQYEHAARLLGWEPETPA